MRLKEFLIFLIPFTILYIIFFAICDKIATKNLVNKQKKTALKVISDESYKKFAAFYGISSTIDINLVKTIFLDNLNYFEKKISIAAKKYNISNYEYAVIILYLEFLTLFQNKAISLEKDLITEFNFQDRRFVDRFLFYFNKKNTYDEILRVGGSNGANELYHIDKNFLIPGVRILNKTVYYYSGWGE